MLVTVKRQLQNLLAGQVLAVSAQESSFLADISRLADKGTIKIVNCEQFKDYFVVEIQAQCDHPFTC
ncbi:MAG: hypothetical protein HWE13_09080 [Gammaproteobacteria bacterium]|nr:hypothetical protein [Gammaproteobacteria bacterium]NVK88268.1 hypothetical protein [Gammaproteobacteria bacterium]